MSFEDYSQGLVRAIQQGTIPQFIAQMNRVLETRPTSYLAWLFVARAYDAAGDVENATHSYAHLLRISRPFHRNTPRLLSEVQAFIERYPSHELVEIAAGRFGANTLRMPRIRPVSGGTNHRGTNGSSTRFTKASVPPESTEAHPNDVADAISVKAPREQVPVGASTTHTEQLISDAGQALQRGDLDAALELLQRAYRFNDRSYNLYVQLAQTFQRLSRYDKALEYLEEGAARFESHQRLALLNLTAQIHSSQRHWPEAVEAYEQLLREEKRGPALRFLRLQLARIYHQRLEDIPRARALLNDVLRANPQDQVAQRMRDALDLPAEPEYELDVMEGDPDSGDLTLDLPDEDGDGLDLISPMLRRDLATADFRDEKILLQGGRPEVADADRLLDQAEKTKASEFGERYPAFLEAAKAYSELPEGSYELERFYRALMRYAMLKGGALVSEMRRRIFSGKVDLTTLRRISDSASSYYLESLSLQVRIDLRYALIPITNLLRAQVAPVLVETGTPVPESLFQSGFADLLRFCHNHPKEEVVRVAYETVVAIGAASNYVWNRLQTVKGGPGMVGRLLFKHRARSRPYRILSTMTGEKFVVQQKPGEVLRKAFLVRRSMMQDMVDFFNSVQRIRLQTQNLQELNILWDKVPHPGILSGTDQKLLEGGSAVLATLLPYSSRSPEERTGILFTARVNIENLLGLIQDHPTYWGRVGFEPLLLRWQAAVRAIEQQRISEMHPRLVARLEPPVFYTREDAIEGGIIIQNVGRATADGAVIHVSLQTLDGAEIADFDDTTVNEEIGVGGTYHHVLRAPLALLPHGDASAYQIRLGSAPIFHQNVLEATHQEFTLEIHQGTEITVDDIPWNEISIPPKHLFKGREQFIGDLIHHLEGPQRNKTYILFGLTRTGKSSILNYLGERLDLHAFSLSGQDFRFLSFGWDIAKANSQSNAQDMWAYLLIENVVNKMRQLLAVGKLEPGDVPEIHNATRVRFREWEPLLDHLKRRHIYPVFLLDEFSYFKNLVDTRRLDASFLAAIRQFAIDGQASFVFAGTYDLRRLIRDPAYGITGQLVNAIETRVSLIDRDPAVSLIRVLEPRLKFTDDAIDHILRLSYRIPYYIQLLCRNCAMYAVKSKRSILGFPEVELVVKALTGDEAESDHTGIPALAPGVFMNNMQTPTDPAEYSALVSTICSLTEGQLVPRLVTYPEIQATWHRHKVRLFQARLATAIKELLDREVIVEGQDEGVPAYRISVDLFRRWWSNEHRNLTLELDAVKAEV